MICPSCGFVNEDGVLFCDRCKADLDMPAARTPRQAPPPMNDPASQPEPIPLEPIPLEPIGLEPIGLEPVHPARAASPRPPAPEPVLAPLQLELAESSPETSPPSPESTGDMPAV